MAHNIAAAQRRGQKVVDEFNRQFTPNTPCFYQPVRGEDKWYPTRTRSEAWLLGHGEPVVKVDGASGCVSISYLAMPGSDRYEAAICEAEETRAAHNSDCSAPPHWVPFTDEDESDRAKSKAITVTTFLSELRQQLTSHFPSLDDGKIDYPTLGMTFAEYENEAKRLQASGQFADGFHTFNELYAHRVRLFCCLMHAYRAAAWWSFKHADGSQMPGWVIAGIDTPAGTATYHLPESEIDNLPIGTNIARGKEWDGHTADDVLERLLSLRRSERDWPVPAAPTSEEEQPPEAEQAVYHYAISVATPRGEIHHDGILHGPMVATMEDYLRFRAEMASDVGATPEQIQVRSMSIIGMQPETITYVQRDETVYLKRLLDELEHVRQVQGADHE